MTNKNTILLGILSVFLLASCSEKEFSSSRNQSSTTGWDYNNRKQGGFEVRDAFEQTPGPGLVFIEGGKLTMGRVEEDVMSDWNNISKTVNVTSFYIDATEVRNLDYLEYLDWIKRHYIYENDIYRTSQVSIEDGIAIYEKALPDTLVWRDKLGENEMFVNNYLRHPAYREYPVVGISWEQANDYCLWRTDRVNERILINAGILLEEGHVDRDPDYIFTTEAYLYGGEDYHTAIINDQLKLRVKNKKDVKANDEGRYANMSDGLLLPNYRLPTEAEWELAALGYMGDNLENRKVYPWEGSGVRNTSRKNQGQLLANFKNGRGGNKGTAGKNSDDNYSLTSPVRSYWPNDYGLFDMAGNVSEWVADVYRPITELTTTTDNNPYRGNVFATKKRDSEASPGENPYIIDKQGRVVDTLVDPSDNIYRRNYKRSNNINFLDGDIESQMGGTINDTEENGSVDNENIVIDKRNKDYGRNESDTLSNNSNEMYNFGVTTLLSDRSRVYKGGSWNDRAYWLSPGARRMLDQSRSSNTIGFRCAMDRTGADKSDLKANQNRGTDYSKERGN